MTGAAESTLRYVALDEPSGYGESARRLVAGLDAIGLTVEYLPWPVAPGADRRDAPLVAHLVPEHYPRVCERLGGRPFIAHTVWETERLPRHWPGLLNTADLVVVPTEWNRRAFVTSGVHVPISVVPHVAALPAAGDGGAPLGLADDVVVFYTVARWDDRKDVGLAVRAFLTAFTADDPVALVVKTGPVADTIETRASLDSSSISGSTALAVARIVREHRRPAHVRLEPAVWTPARIAGLHERGDCFVSLSHGDGWDLGAFDAAAYGNPVVATGWGGPLAYLDPDMAWLVEFDLVPVRHSVPASYSPDQRWAAARLEHAVELLREIAADPEKARRRAAPLAAAVRERFAATAVAHQFVDALASVETR